jgi:hypothetical protein
LNLFLDKNIDFFPPLTFELIKLLINYYLVLGDCLVHGSHQLELQGIAGLLDECHHLIMGGPLDVLFVDAHDVVTVFHTTEL